MTGKQMVEFIRKMTKQNLVELLPLLEYTFNIVYPVAYSKEGVESRLGYQLTDVEWSRYKLTVLAAYNRTFPDMDAAIREEFTSGENPAP